MEVTGMRLRTGNQMELIVLADLHPNMPIIPKRIVDNFGPNHVAIKSRALFQIRNVERDVIEMHAQPLSATQSIKQLRKI